MMCSLRMLSLLFKTVTVIGLTVRRSSLDRNHCSGAKVRTFCNCFFVVVAGLMVSTSFAKEPADQDNKTTQARIVVSQDGSHFVLEGSTKPFVVWGVNYDHDAVGQGRLIEDYWHDEWETVVEDFQEIRDLNANVVRIHLQLGRFMETATKPNSKNLKKLAELIKLAEDNGLYLDITGLACYHKADIPDWYDSLPEQQRWGVQANFWREVATICRESSAIFCYDLMNEPVLPGKDGEKEWLAGELGGKFFVQRISLDLAGRERKEVAAAWVKRMTEAIREVDKSHLITLGVIPWAHSFKNAKPLFYSPEVSGPLDFVSVHFYPKKDHIDESLAALRVYEIGKPLVIEEIFPLSAGQDQTVEFIERSRDIADGWISFYWGVTVEEYKSKEGIVEAIMAEWLTWFKENAPPK
ncbi:Cellulase (glycosyl hydrolase family 5) [Thalassoglobus polymorphus]|uniref:Cellulase (Glycosyl hydrolase family 5) n=2 Tax=Thalassoglobus polymorphus TaxID=2527994 RepID=A0A517QS79_9PLAN|nr:Cellulase (glycosyl hydrolase family 5) [Thalassoglobus polymorphus]